MQRLKHITFIEHGSLTPVTCQYEVGRDGVIAIEKDGDITIKYNKDKTIFSKKRINIVGMQLATYEIELTVEYWKGRYARLYKKSFSGLS
jgi:hypothetical protein